MYQLCYTVRGWGIRVSALLHCKGMGNMCISFAFVTKARRPGEAFARHTDTRLYSCTNPISVPFGTTVNSIPTEYTGNRSKREDISCKVSTLGSG